MSLDPKDFKFLTDTVKDYSGIVLTEDKGYLLENRLQPIAHKYGLKDLGELVEYTKENKDSSLLVEIIEAMTTNESFFFRDIKPFHYLVQDAIPKVLAKCPGKKNIKIWSAACSTGQEAYSIAMSIKEDAALSDIEFEIIATDLDYSVVEKAKEAVYTQFEVQRGVPINLLIKYFTQEEDQWRVKPDIKGNVKFEKANLLSDLSNLGAFDIIFCRNVLIYFDEETKAKVINSICNNMEKHSTLFLGSTESMLGIDTKVVSAKKSGSDEIAAGIFCFDS